jgi:tRNA (mo5U34)-methyltransferase
VPAALAGDIAEEAARYFWWHSIDLGGGFVTPGHKTPEMMAAEFANTFDRLDLRGKSVLDIGAWTGGFSVEARRRGARTVTALDHYTWNHPGFRGREAFDLVNRVTGADIRAVDLDLDAPALDLGGVGRFDIVLFLGVFYHLKNPIGALRQIAELAREVLVVETHIEHFSPERPAMMFYPGAELAGDDTNWWGPNRACLVEPLGVVGFRRVIASPGWGSSREVFHAFRN